MNDSTYHFSKDIKSRSHGTLKEMYQVILNQISSHEEYTVRVVCTDKNVKTIHNDLSRMIELQGCKVMLDKDGVIVKKIMSIRQLIKRFGSFFNLTLSNLNPAVVIAPFSFHRPYVQVLQYAKHRRPSHRRFCL